MDIGIKDILKVYDSETLTRINEGQSQKYSQWWSMVSMVSTTVKYAQWGSMGVDGGRWCQIGQVRSMVVNYDHFGLMGFN